MAVALLALWLEFQRAERQSRRAASAAEAARESDAESRVRLAEAHGRRGDWHKVLDAVDAARALGHDSVRLAIEEAQAFEATFRFDRAKAVLAGLLERTDLGRSRAKVELLLADLDVHRIENPEQNLDRVQAALDSGDLDPADREFALALLARDTREARRHLELALQRDGDHRRASDMYANLLLAMGDLEACRSFATVMVSRFPRDFLAVGFAAFIARIDGDSQRAERLLLRAREFGGERGEPYVELLVDCADLIRSAGKALLEAQGEAEFGVFQKVTRLLTRASGVVRERGGGVFRFPPVVARLFGGKITRAPRETRLESVAHNLHNGALLLLAGQLRLLVGDYDRAEEFLVAARDAPSFLVGRAYCSRMLVLCLRLRIERARPIGAESIAVTDRLRAEAHRLLITPRRTLADLELVYDSAFGLADWELAESASGLWRFESNRSPASMTAHARILAARGHRTAAVRVLEAVLKRAPKCEEALWLRRDLDRK